MTAFIGPGMRESAVTQRAITLLRHHVSEINARAITRHAVSAAYQHSGADEPSSAGFFEELSRSSAIFLAPHQRQQFLEELRAALPAAESSGSIAPRAIRIRGEGDLATTRDATREICEALGSSGFHAQKVITAASELARNIAKYVGDGHVHLSVDRATRCIVVRAEDQGPGIRDVQQILAGHYKSKTGMGRGLMGVKRLADSFEIETGPRGTSVTASFCSNGRANFDGRNQP